MEIKFVDLFAGIGGIRKGLELAAKKYGMRTSCVLSSEIKPHAISVLGQNYPHEKVEGDILQRLTQMIFRISVFYALVSRVKHSAQQEVEKGLQIHAGRFF